MEESLWAAASQKMGEEGKNSLMPKFRVHGTTTVEVIVDIDAESYEEAINKANEDFGSISEGASDDNGEFRVEGEGDIKFVFDEEFDYKWATLTDG